MDLFESLSSAIAYTRTFFSRWLDWLILMILTIIPIVDFIVFGYYAKVLRDGASSKAPPKIEGYAEMFVDGLKVFVVGLIYAIPVMIITVPIIYFADTVIFLIVALIVDLIIFIFTFMATVYMFKTGSFGKAFAFGEIWNAIRKIGLLQYLISFIVFIVLIVIVVVIAVLFYEIPIIGLFIAIVIALALSVLVMTTFLRSFGLLYDSAMGTGGVATPAVAPAPALPGTPPPAPPTA